MINGLQMPDAVTVYISTVLLALLQADWSEPCQIQIVRTPGIGSGYEMTARTHTCPTQRIEIATCTDHACEHAGREHVHPVTNLLEIANGQ